MYVPLQYLGKNFTFFFLVQNDFNVAIWCRWAETFLDK